MASCEAEGRRRSSSAVMAGCCTLRALVWACTSRVSPLPAGSTSTVGSSTAARSALHKRARHRRELLAAHLGAEAPRLLREVQRAAGKGRRKH
eukprot:7380684-Alexandrium_andersonii.AAC.1